MYGSNPLTHPLPSLPILCHIPSHKLTHLLVGIKTPFAGFLSALVGCHQSCYSFRSSEVACSVCSLFCILATQKTDLFQYFLPLSFLLSLFGSQTCTVPGLTSHCSLSIVFLLFDSAAAHPFKASDNIALDHQIDHWSKLQE